MNRLLFDFQVDKSTSTINVKRQFDAELNMVWDAWTNPEILDQWWAPKPYRTNTISMDFKEGGSWLYFMISPENEKHYCLADYKKVVVKKSYSALDAFCDEQGKINTEFPRSLWTNSFEEQSGQTTVSIKIKYEKLDDLEKILQLGFKEGFTMALGNLDELIAKGKLK